MTDYILNGWEDKDLWVLSNAVWHVDGHLDCGQDSSSGYGERTVVTQNKKWILKYLDTGKRYGQGNLWGNQAELYLQGDPNPVIFRRLHDAVNERRIWSLIYNGDVKDEYIIDGGVWYPWLGAFYTNWIRKEGTIYTLNRDEVYTGHLTWHSGPDVKVVKLRFSTAGTSTFSRFRPPDWYYTEAIVVSDTYGFIL